MVYLFCLLENGSLASTYGLGRTPGFVICEIRHGMGAIVRVAHRLVARELELTKSLRSFLSQAYIAVRLYHASPIMWQLCMDGTQEVMIPRLRGLEKRAAARLLVVGDARNLSGLF